MKSKGNLYSQPAQEVNTNSRSETEYFETQFQTINSVLLTPYDELVRQGKANPDLYSTFDKKEPLDGRLQLTLRDHQKRSILA